MDSKLFPLIIAEIKRKLFKVSYPKLFTCLKELSEEEVWARPNENSNSIGNLILHLYGNVHQWIISGLGNEPDIRQRQKEFAEKGPIPINELTSKLEELELKINLTLDNLTIEDLLQERIIQGAKENGISILIHVVEHFSYHVGQVVYVVKAKKNIDLNFYKGKDLNSLNSG